MNLTKKNEDEVCNHGSKQIKQSIRINERDRN